MPRKIGKNKARKLRYTKMSFIRQMLPLVDALEAAKEAEVGGSKKLIEDIFKKNGVVEIRSTK